MSTQRLSVLFMLGLVAFWLLSGWYFYSKLTHEQNSYQQQQLADLALAWKAVERWKETEGRDITFQLFDPHMDAIELATNLETLRQDIANLDNSFEHIFLLAADSQKILLDKYPEFLHPSLINQAWLHTNPNFNPAFPAKPVSNVGQNLAQKLAARPDIAEQMNAGNSFALVEKDFNTTYVVSFLAVYDFSQTNQAYLLAINPAPILDGLNRSFIENMLVIFLMLLALGWVLYSLLKNREELRIAATAFNVQEGITVTDTKGRILKVNDSFTRLTGYQAHEVIGQTPAILSSGLQDKMFYQTMWKTLKEQGSWQGEIWNRRKNGELYVEWLAITAVYNHRNEVTHYVGAFLDITQRKEDEEQIRRLAFYDSLTDLPNRRLLNDRIEHALATSSRTYRNGAILFIDMDNFKTLNDTKGHDVGDLMLQEVAKRLKSCVRESDTVSRLGGDEFVVLIENLNSNQQKAYMEAEFVAEEIRTSLNQPYHFSDYIHFSSPSIGVALFTGYPSTTLDELMKNADSAMYQAKNAGRNRIRVFDPEMQRLFEKRSVLEKDLNQALENDEFEIFLQPVFDLKTNKILSAEALIRWNHPEKGVVLPEEFLEIAEETGLLQQISNRLLEQVCEWLVRWAEQPGLAELQISVNLTTSQLQIDEFRKRIKNCLDLYRVPKYRLVIEISELNLPKDIERLQEDMRELIAEGVLFAMDNYGSGKLSIPSLSQLPVEQLKLDCNLIGKNFAPSKKQLICALKSVADSLGVKVLAVGVESKLQSEYLLEQGYRVQQGNLFSAPIGLAEFEEMVGKTAASKTLADE